RAAGANSANRIRLIKGSRIITRKFWPGGQAYLLQNSDKRVIFVNPYENDLALIGTTDVPFSGHAEHVAIDGEEIDYLLGVTNRYFVNGPTRADVIVPSQAFGRCSTTRPTTRARSRATMCSTSTPLLELRHFYPSSAARSPPTVASRSKRSIIWRRSFRP